MISGFCCHVDLWLGTRTSLAWSNSTYMCTAAAMRVRQRPDSIWWWGLLWVSSWIGIAATETENSQKMTWLLSATTESMPEVQLQSALSVPKPKQKSKFGRPLVHVFEYNSAENEPIWLNNNNNPICKAPECQKTSVALKTSVTQAIHALACAYLYHHRRRLRWLWWQSAIKLLFFTTCFSYCSNFQVINNKY